MKKHGFLQILLCLIPVLVFISVITPIMADCLVKEIGGGNILSNSNVETSNNDLIICESGSVATGTVRGREGNDTILIYHQSGTLHDIQGDGVASGAGNDMITIFEGVSVEDIAGDYGVTDGKLGDDQIILHGIADSVYGDELYSDSGTDFGGDDVIDVFGIVNLFLVGDGIFAGTNFIDHGGNDVITIYEGAIAKHSVFGDWLRSSNVSSTGGDDIITIAGTVIDDVYGDYNEIGRGGDDVIYVLESGVVQDDILGDRLSASNAASIGGNDTITIAGTVIDTVYGDYIAVGTGGEDTIVVTKTGKVGTTGTSHNIYGDYRTNSNLVTKGADDKFFIEGDVFGSISGDYMGDSGGNDEIVIGTNGFIQVDIYGDFLWKDIGHNGADNIQISGEVFGDVEGDGYKGNGVDDSIFVEASGNVGGSVYGDGTFKTIGNANGGEDRITIVGDINGDVRGDEVDGNGGKDSIVIQGVAGGYKAIGRVQGNLIGDDVDGNGVADNIAMTRYSKVYGGVYGDNLYSNIGGNGGWDNIQIDGVVGRPDVPTGVYGDNTGGNGGKDFILIGRYGMVYGSVIGDAVNGKGGEDIIWIDGTVTENVIGDDANNDNVKDQIAVRENGLVKGSVIGDGSTSSYNGGWDVINVMGGQVNQDVVGDDVGGNGGNDFIAIRMNGSVKGDLIGDAATQNGGNDTLSLTNGTIEGDIIGDGVILGNGGNDKINVLVSGIVKGDIIGDQANFSGIAGDDSIFVAGKVNGRIVGDNSTQGGVAGNDNIQISPSGMIDKGIWGDNTRGDGGTDIIKVNGVISFGGIQGDIVDGDGGNDTISVFGLGDITGNIIGDNALGMGGNDVILVAKGGKVSGQILGDFSRGNGGDDKITIEGLVTKNVEGDRHPPSSFANGGDDTIVVEESGIVQGNVYGDNSPGNGGDDKIDIKGRVNGNVLGDKVGGAGGNDIIRIFSTGVVVGSVCGRNFCNDNAGDNVIFLDEDANPALDSADTIIVAGKVLGDVIAGTTYGSHSDDIVVVFEGAEIGGTIYAGDEGKGDTFVYVENIINEEKSISEVVDSVSEKNGKVTVNGVTYTLDDVENVAGAVGQIACFGMDYRLNKTSDGCSARSGAEKDAIQWHRDNPGNDGRLPGLEGCAVYTYGNGLRVYEILDGAEGELVAEIWGDVLSDAPASNELLGQTANGNVSLYHLASGELQIECRNLVDGKTQVRVLSDMAGTVSNAYDKS